MISLGGVVLSKDLIYEERFGYPNQAYSRRVTLLGKVIIQHSPILGRLISLATVDMFGATIGYFQKDQLDQLKAFEDAMTEIVFIYEAESMNVIIAPGGMEVSPIVPRPTHANSDYFTGTINLIEIAV